jgi:hypothetical protein
MPAGAHAGGAVAMSGETPSDNLLYNGVPLDPTPSNRQGWGHVHLGRSLPIAGTPTSSWNMQVSPGVNFER